MAPLPFRADRLDPLRLVGQRLLLVSSDEGLRTDLGGRLEEAGYEVMGCPGPCFPGYTCVGLRGQPCALEHAAEICIIDLHPVAGELVDRTARTELVAHYLPGRRAVVVLVDGHDSLEIEGLSGVLTLDRAVDAAALTQALRELA